jgi:hypothetical protein
MNRRGTSLLFVVLVLALLGGLAGVLFGMLRLRWLGGESALRSARVRTVADGESERLLAEWDPLVADSLSVGGQVALPPRSTVGRIRIADSLFRLDRSLYLAQVVAEDRGRDGALLARGIAGRLVRPVQATVPDSQAVLTAGTVTLEGSPLVSGEDHLPAGWGGVCSNPFPSGAGVRSGSAAPVGGTCETGTCVTGLPPALTDGGLRGGFLDTLSGLRIADLVRAYDHSVAGVISAIGPVESGGSCDRGSSLNWGDPAGPGAPCSGYFPLLVAAPGTRIAGGAGQGVLIGLGSVELDGDLAFYGVVLARGTLTLRDRARVVGTVLAEDSVVLVGTSRVERSVCGVQRALAGAARPLGSVMRSWSRTP